jgi:hypothetical protein
MREIKPLFIPLKRKYYERFISGRKNHELRLEGKRWNSKTCFAGRKVVLSLGYGKYDRVEGVIRDTYTVENCGNIDFIELYGKGKTARVIAVGIYPNSRVIGNIHERKPK